MAEDDLLLSVLQQATVRIDISDVVSGTGFLVAPNQVVTCYHVIEPALLPGSGWADVSVLDSSGAVSTPTHASRYDKNTDLATLHLERPVTVPVVGLDDRVGTDDELYAWGFTPDKRDGLPATYEAEGQLGGESSPWIKFKAGQVASGMSGAPLLNRRTGGVCGVLKRTRDARQALGGYGIPIETLFRTFQQLPGVNADSLAADQRWRTSMTVRQKKQGTSLPAAATTRSVDLVIDIGQEQDRWAVKARLLPDEQAWPTEPVDLNSVRSEVARLFRLLRARDRLDEAQKCKLLGQVLARAVLPPQARKNFDELYAQQDVRVDLSLHFQAAADDDLVYLPWEMLNLPGTGDRVAVSLASSPRMTLARVHCVEPAQRPVTPRVDLSVAVVRAPDAPGQLRPVEVLARSTLAALTDVLPYPPTDLAAGTPAALEEHLEAGETDVIHYIGYGRFHEQRDEVAFNGDPFEQVTFLTAESFAEGVSLGRPPLLVVLQSCEVPRQDPARVPADLAAMAPELLLRGVAAVLVLPEAQEGEDHGVQLTSFYKGILAGRSIQDVVQSLRSSRPVRSRPWTYPSLFLRHPGELRLVRAPAGGRGGRS